jgi:N-acetylneuraminic acid mutarotase
MMLWRASSCLPAHHNDIYRYNCGTSTWTRIATNGDVPIQRVRMGFTATPNGTIYLFGGYSDYNGELER